jgi:hypothetical protein
MICDALSLGAHEHAEAGASSHITPLDQKHRPVAIVLDFVDPALPLRGLINEGRKLWLDESKLASYAGRGPSIGIS